MEGLIFIIIIGLVIRSVRLQKRRQQSQNKGETAQDLLKRIENGNASASAYNRPIQNSHVSSVVSTIPREMGAVNHPASNVPGEVAHAKQAGKTAPVQAQNKEQKSAKANEKVEIVQKEGESTTQFLLRKAQADQLEHKKEKLEQKREEAKSYGNLNYAIRWMEGDSIPSGMWMVKCGYCGAENLISARSRKFNCYFCREEL